MKKEIHPKSKLTTFKCATCGASYQIMSTCKSDVISIDVCSNCHPIFVGKVTDNTVKGRAEKLAKKFVVQTKPTTKTTKKRQRSNKSKTISLDKLSA